MGRRIGGAGWRGRIGERCERGKEGHESARQGKEMKVGKTNCYICVATKTREIFFSIRFQIAGIFLWFEAFSFFNSFLFGAFLFR